MKKYFLIAVLFMLFAGCTKEELIEERSFDNQSVVKLMAASITETFESATKGSYTAASVTFTSGSWYLDDALIGNSTSDKKFDAQSVRIRNTGKLTSYNTTNGISTVTVYSAIYGTDASSTWELYYSTNNGTTWVKSGSTITPTSAMVSTVFNINQSGSVKIEIRKISGGTARINIDNVIIAEITTTVIATRDNNMALGNPSNATSVITNFTNYLIVRNEYSLSYHRDNGTPNWVSWHLSTAWLGNAPRPTNFTSDNTLPAGWYRVTTSNYTNTGFDRGHMCPASDRDYNDVEIANTFIMTNIIPQAPYNNQQPWRLLEEYCRSLAEAGNEMYIISGPFGSGGTGDNGGVTTTIASGKVKVPSYVWKVILILPNGSSDVTRVTAATRVIAIWMPNNISVTTAWGNYRTTVDYIESKTGLNLFSAVPVSIQSSLESKIDNGPTN